MSDFLSRLADRAVAPQPIVRPRLQLYYESPIAHGFERPFEEHIEVRSERGGVTESSQKNHPRPGDTEATPRQSKERVDQSSVTPRETEAVKQRESVQTVFTRRDEFRVSPSPDGPQSIHTVGAAGAEVQQQSAMWKRERQLDHSDSVPINQGRPMSFRGGINHDPPKPPLKSDWEIEQQATQKGPIQSQTLSHDGSSAVMRPPLLPVVASVKKMFKSDDVERAPRVSPVQTPRTESSVSARTTVQVTIGRVEIRAVPPPEPMQQSNTISSNGRLSLDEYLKRQSGVAR